MACTAPLQCYYSNKLNETGKRSIVFDYKKSYMGTDPTVPKSLQIPCGKCLQCKADQSLMWSIRGYHESTLHPYNSFLTLTYDDEHLPADKKIDKRTLQLFIKRLRKAVAPLKLRYIACGEYGEKSRRPHYHAIIFGTDFLHDKLPITDKLYTSQTVIDCWPQGFVSIAPVTMSSICYVCGYVLKKAGDDDTFSLMSRRPGIGHDWLDRYKSDLTRTGKVAIEGREYAISPRYVQWSEGDFEEVKKARMEYAKTRSKRFDPIETRRRADNREKNRRAIIKQREEQL